MALNSDSFNRVRVGGSGFTVFRWETTPLAFCRQVAHTSPAPVSDPSPIQPMDARYPIQVITPAAAGMGSLTLDMYELYGAQVWERLGIDAAAQTGGTFNGAVDIVDIFVRQAALAKPIQVVKYIQPPTIRGRNITAYTEEYHGVVITAVTDGETIEVGTMEVRKEITLAYTHMTRGGRNSAGAKEGVPAGSFDSITT